MLHFFTSIGCQDVFWRIIKWLYDCNSCLVQYNSNVFGQICAIFFNLLTCCLDGFFYLVPYRRNAFSHLVLAPWKTGVCQCWTKTIVFGEEIRILVFQYARYLEHWYSIVSLNKILVNKSWYVVNANGYFKLLRCYLYFLNHYWWLACRITVGCNRCPNTFGRLV